MNKSQIIPLALALAFAGCQSHTDVVELPPKKVDAAAPTPRTHYVTEPSRGATSVSATPKIPTPEEYNAIDRSPSSQ